jgi:hypothetical protein
MHESLGSLFSLSPLFLFSLAPFLFLPTGGISLWLHPYPHPSRSSLSLSLSLSLSSPRGSGGAEAEQALVRAHAARGGPERVVARQALGPARERAAHSTLEQARCWRGGRAERLAGAGASRRAGGADAGGSWRRRTSGGGTQEALAACAGARAVQERSTGAQATQAAGRAGGCGSGRRSWSTQARAQEELRWRASTRDARTRWHRP